MYYVNHVISQRQLNDIKLDFLNIYIIKIHELNFKSLSLKTIIQI